ncbi:hypothetical protein D3C78_1544580 [compost metagenome]
MASEAATYSCELPQGTQMDVLLLDFDLDYVRGFENLLVSNADHVGSLGEKAPSVLAVGARTSEKAGLKFVSVRPTHLA